MMPAELTKKTHSANEKDPVCGMEVDPADSAGSWTHNQVEYHFCSKHCLDDFKKNPSNFLKQEVSAPKVGETGKLKTYFPLMLILAYLLGAVGIAAWKTGDSSLTHAMNHFMAGFFFVFSFFKLLDLKGFAESYQSYDIVAKRSVFYAYLYPFLELALGIALFAQWEPFFTNIATAVLMGVSSIGVLQSVLKKQKIKCACLGTQFNLPMSTVTLVEDLAMLVMAVSMLVFSHGAGLS